MTISKKDHTPLVSIVTVVFNAKDDVEKTIKSVMNQTYNNIEHIVIDGSSNDGTVEVIKKYENHIDYWISQEDDGIYDAMNKGIKAAKGDWINFMNAGDVFFEPKTLDKVGFGMHKESSLIYGNSIINNKVEFAAPLNQLKYGVIMACHQSMFFSLDIKHRSYVFYDLSYRVNADYELVNRLYLAFNSFSKLNQTIAKYKGDGFSTLFIWQLRRDRYRALYNNYGIIGIIRGLLFRVKKL
ncbi:glycosyltransferase [Gammaproteobacteria bacterium]|nr:glycosyltransferase [Gammaproteobacteria bacterium]